MILDIDQGRYIQTLFYSTGWNNSIDFTLPILSNITPITNVGEYNYLIENLFTIGENRYRIKVDLDIEPEDLQRIDTVEIVTKTENKVIYAENGIKIFEVDELPTPSLQETGKIYKYQNELFTGIEKPVAYTIGDKLGGSIKFETISDLSGLCNVTNLQQLNLIETPNYYLSIIEVLSLLGLSGIGKCIGVALLDKATQTPVSFAYVYCDMLTVAQFNQTVGSRFGLSISEFGWVTDSIDTKNISEELIENMLDKETLKAFSAIYGVPLTQFVYSSNSTYHFSSNLDEVCYREKEVINIPNTITQISKFAFYYNDNLKKITIPESVTKIGNSAFKYCGALTSIVIPNSVTELGQETFSETGLSNVVLSNNLQELPNGCFSRCVYLKNINIPSGVQAIGASVFKNCSQLKTIVIPSGVTIIGSSAFENCDNLTNVYFTGTQSEWNSIIIESGNEALTSATISFNYAE